MIHCLAVFVRMNLLHEEWLAALIVAVAEA